MPTTQLVVIFILAIACIAVLGAFLYFNASAEQRVEIQTRLFVQLVGTVLLGAIVTYSIYLIEHSREAEERHSQEIATGTQNKKRVLALIKRELVSNRGVLKSKEGAFDARQRLKSEFWKISGLSGDLRWIDDLDLLNSIAQAYADVDISADWDKRLMDAVSGPTINMNFSDGTSKTVMQMLDPIARDSYKTAATSVNAALDRLKDY